MCQRTGTYTVRRRVRASFSPEIVQAAAVKELNHSLTTIRWRTFCSIQPWVAQVTVTPFRDENSPCPYYGIRHRHTVSQWKQPLSILWHKSPSHHFVVKTVLVHITAQLTVTHHFVVKIVLVHIMAQLTVTPFRSKDSPGPYYGTTHCHTISRWKQFWSILWHNALWHHFVVKISPGPY